MTKERYDELKKQGGTIWHWEHGEIKLEDTDICEEKDLSGNHTGWALVYFGTGYDIFLELKDLEEDATKGKWKHKTTAERTERFEPPMWEEIENEYEFHFTCQNYTHKKSNETLSTPQHFIFYVNKNVEPSYNHILIRNCKFYPLNIIVFDEPATKENYEKACEIVRDLFNKGDKE